MPRRLTKSRRLDSLSHTEEGSGSTESLQLEDTAEGCSPSHIAPTTHPTVPTSFATLEPSHSVFVSETNKKNKSNASRQLPIVSIYNLRPRKQLVCATPAGPSVKRKRQCSVQFKAPGADSGSFQMPPRSSIYNLRPRKQSVRLTPAGSSKRKRQKLAKPDSPKASTVPVHPVIEPFNEHAVEVSPAIQISDKIAKSPSHDSEDDGRLSDISTTPSGDSENVDESVPDHPEQSEEQSEQSEEQSSSPSYSRCEGVKQYVPGDTIVFPRSQIEFRNAVETNADNLNLTIVGKLRQLEDGVLYKVVDMLTNEFSALKVISQFSKIYSPEEFDEDGNRNEIKCLQQVDHPHIVSFKATFQNETHLFLMFEFCEYGSLITFLGERGVLTEVEVKLLFIQLLSAVHDLHSKGICHRNIGPENILIAKTADSTGICLKLSEFGRSRSYEHKPSSLGVRIDLEMLGYLLRKFFRLWPHAGTLAWWSDEFKDLYLWIQDICPVTIEEYVNHPWIASSNPFPEKIPISALVQRPDFSDLSPEASNRPGLETLKEMGLDGLIVDEPSGEDS